MEKNKKEYWFVYWTEFNMNRKWMVEAFPPMTDVPWELHGNRLHYAYICENQEQADALAAKCNEAYERYGSDNDKYCDCIRAIIREFREPYEEWHWLYAD